MNIKQALDSIREKLDSCRRELDILQNFLMGIPPVKFDEDTMGVKKQMKDIANPTTPPKK